MSEERETDWTTDTGLDFNSEEVTDLMSRHSAELHQALGVQSVLIIAVMGHDEETCTQYSRKGPMPFAMYGAHRYLKSIHEPEGE